MVIKSKDDIQPALTALEQLLALKTLSKKQREFVEAELDNVRGGARGEKNAAYHIDFHLKDSKNWTIIHDLRLEHNGRVAQIDHVVIGRMFDIFVIESKSVKTALRVAPNGEFEVKTRWGWKGMESPVEQNKRHIKVLSDLIKDEKLTPTRMGFHIRPTFRNWVLIPPECNISKHSEDATILKMDMFDRRIEEFINRTPTSEILNIAKVCSPETVAEFGQKLVSYHRQASFDFAAKFGISTTPEVSLSRTAAVASEPKTQVFEATGDFDKKRCERCGTTVEAKVVYFCRFNKNRFGGRVLCRSCQSSAAAEPAAPVTSDTLSAAKCAQCGSPVDSKVVAFCRFNSQKFERRILCRPCQATARIPTS